MTRAAIALALFLLPAATARAQAPTLEWTSSAAAPTAVVNPRFVPTLSVPLAVAGTTAMVLGYAGSVTFAALSQGDCDPGYLSAIPIAGGVVAAIAFGTCETARYPGGSSLLSFAIIELAVPTLVQIAGIILVALSGSGASRLQARGPTALSLDARGLVLAF
jgi:hypothetical protein